MSGDKSPPSLYCGGQKDSATRIGGRTSDRRIGHLKKGNQPCSNRHLIGPHIFMAIIFVITQGRGDM